MSVLEQKYNYFINRAKKGEKYLDNPNTPKEEVEKWLPTFNKLANIISVLQYELEKELGRKLTYEEVWNGFKGVEPLKE
jgi:hypothetical protein